MAKSQYKTKQYTEMLDFMASVPGQQMTVQEIFEGMKNRGSRIGMTTVYRQLERLVEAGEVNRYVLDSNGGALFEYIDRQTNCHKPACFHCKCESCGRLIHLECDEISNLQEHMLAHHGFSLDPVRTVFYGVCEECRSKIVGIPVPGV